MAKHGTIIFLLFISFFNFSLSYPQESMTNKEFEEYVNALMRNDQHLDAERIIHLGDSLYKTTNIDLNKIRAIFVCINGYHMKSDRVNALKYALKADSLATVSKSVLECRTSGVVAAQYRYLKLYDESIKYLNKTVKTAYRLRGKDVPITKILAYGELTAIHFEKKEYRETITSAKEQIELIEETSVNFPDSAYLNTYNTYSISAYLSMGDVDILT